MLMDFSVILVLELHVKNVHVAVILILIALAIVIQSQVNAKNAYLILLASTARSANQVFGAMHYLSQKVTARLAGLFLFSFFLHIIYKNLNIILNIIFDKFH